MTINELITKMNIYKQEIYRRGLVIALCVLLPGIAVIVAVGFWINPFTPPLWKGIVYYCALLLFVAANIAIYTYTVAISLPKKLELFCPQCHKVIIKIAPQSLIEKGCCDNCSAQIIDQEIPRGQITEMAENLIKVQSEVVENR